MKYDVVALGELLVDFTPSGQSAQGNPLYEANPGGAPCNVLAILTKLGKQTGFIGKVGNDLHGRFLTRAIRSVGIDDRGLVGTDENDTTLAFVALGSDGDREFSFIRRAGADTALVPAEVDREMIAAARIFHFGSLSLTHEAARDATRFAVDCARRQQCLISFDPNLRELLWRSLAEAKEQMLWGCGQCSIIKLAKEELFFLTDAQSIEAGVSLLRERYANLRLILVTDGKDGAHAFYGPEKVHCGAYLHVQTVDTTGAGDTFMGCCLDYVLEHGLDGLTGADLKRMLQYANAAAALITTKKGALCVMPDRAEIERLISGAQGAHGE